MAREAGRSLSRPSGIAHQDAPYAVDSGGSGSVPVDIDASTPAGTYRLTAHDATGNELAQTVEFYISHD